MSRLGFGCGIGALLLGCTDAALTTAPPAIQDAAATAPAPTITVISRDTRFVVREHMIAAVEMQLSGEPFAEAMGRNLSLYSRDSRPPDIYFDNDPNSFGPYTDLAGFSSAIESYEYSKQPMNNLSFESGAGLSLAYGPLLNPMGAMGKAACEGLRDRVQHLGAASNATSRYIHPHGGADGDGGSDNPLGWPGIWPTLEPFMAFDPTIAPTNSVSLACSITSDDDPGASGALMSDDYECDATTLHLPDRAAQIDSAISPGSSGWAGWKSALWVLNYLQSMHDSAETAITGVSVTDLPNVGVPANAVLSDDMGDTPAPVAGTFLGSSDIEGFQAGMMLTSLDNEAEDWLTARTTTDGATLGGFADLKTALAYDFNAPLRWFPAEISVTESMDAGCSFPRPSAFSIRAGGSHLLDLAGMLGTYASLFSLTDLGNAAVGGSQAAQAYFDGDPFPADNQLPDGEATLHDRSLAMLRVTLVNLARMHLDAASGVLVDDASVSGGVASHGTTVSASSAAYMLLALRTTRRSLSDQLALYNNTRPDTATVVTPLDAPPITTTETITDELNTLILQQSNLFYDHLTDSSGRAWLGWDVSKSEHTSDDDALDAHTAAIRGLIVAFLSTGDTKFRDRALSVFQRVDANFYDSVARLYRLTSGDTSSTIEYTPLRFGLLQAMLRDTYEIVVRGAENAIIEDRVGRLNKLLLNGWDDRNGDKKVDWPDECVQVANGLGLGGLQMAERTLSGETGSVADVFDAGPRVVATDREPDCVPEISAAKLPSALADSIVFQIAKGQP